MTFDKYNRNPAESPLNSPSCISAWLVSLPVLTVISVTNQILSENTFFFTAHGISQEALLLALVLLIIGLVVGGTLFIRTSRRILGSTAYRWFVFCLALCVSFLFIGSLFSLSPGLIMWKPLKGGPIRLVNLLAGSFTLSLIVVFVLAVDLERSSLRSWSSLRELIKRSARKLRGSPYIGIFLISWSSLLLYVQANEFFAEVEPFRSGILRWSTALMVAVLFAKIATSKSGGRVVLLVSSVISVSPLIFVRSDSNEFENRAVSFDQGQDKPNILWIVVDELQYSVLFDSNGSVREIFPNLRRFQSEATTFRNAFATAAYTEAAIPTMLNGVGEVNELSFQELQEVQRSSGVLKWLGDSYIVTTQSPWFNTNRRRDLIEKQVNQGTAALGDPAINVLNPVTGNSNHHRPFWDRLKLLLLDFTAVAGRSTLHPRLAGHFPAIDSRWSNFWDSIEVQQAQQFSDQDQWMSNLLNQDEPIFAFFHTLEVHVYYDRDPNGALLSIPSLNWTKPLSASEVSLQRRMYVIDLLEFDRQFAKLIEVFSSRHNISNTLIILSADHGRSFSPNINFRSGSSPEEQWAEVAHVPLIVKFPGQSVGTDIDRIVSNGQIAKTILDESGVIGLSGGRLLSPSLGDRQAFFPTPYQFDQGVGRAWFGEWQATRSDHWKPEDLHSFVNANPFAVGVRADMIGDEIPQSAKQISIIAKGIKASESSFVTLTVKVSREDCINSDIGLVSERGKVIGTVVWVETKGDTRVGTGIVSLISVDDVQLWCPL